MFVVCSIVFALSLVGVTSPWLLYPLMLGLLSDLPRAALTSRRLQSDPDEPSLSILIPAHNEEDHIDGRIANALASAVDERSVEVIVGCDGCTDGTLNIVQAWCQRDARVQVLVREQRAGKASMLNWLMDVCRADTVLLTDASARMTSGALLQLRQRLEQPGVGAAVPRYRVGTSSELARASRADQKQTAETGYWTVETAIKALASNRQALLGAHGAAWLADRHLLETLPADTINDDFLLSFHIRTKGLVVSYCPEAEVFDTPTPNVKASYLRWVRIARGNFQMLWRQRRWMHPRHGRVAWSLAAHKLAKSLMPLFAIGATIGLVGMAIIGLKGQQIEADVGLATKAVLLVALAIGLIPIRTAERIWRIGRLAIVSQVAYLVGLSQWVRGTGTVLWRRGDEANSHPATLAAAEVLPWRVAVAKRALDVTAAGVGLVLLSPLFAVVSLAIRLDSKGPAFFRQSRVCGRRKDGLVSYTMFKFRTMREDAEVASGPVWASENDPRITRLGRLLRKTRIDELPQLMNVLVGDMSLVGPRPERQHFTDQLEVSIPAYHDRLAGLKPGITGWAQIHCAYDTSLESVQTKLLYDLTYAAHLHSFSAWARIEVGILARTVVVALTGKGAR